MVDLQCDVIESGVNRSDRSQMLLQYLECLSLDRNRSFLGVGLRLTLHPVRIQLLVSLTVDITHDYISAVQQGCCSALPKASSRTCDHITQQAMGIMLCSSMQAMPLTCIY